MLPIDEFDKLIQFQPEAINAQFEGQCDACGEDTLWSYQLKEYMKVDTDGSEQCGFFCATCGFSNAGSRERQFFIPYALDLDEGMSEF